MRLAFFGTPAAAVPSLDALVVAGHDVQVVITRPDRRRGRGSALSPSPVKAAALERGLRVGHRLSDLENFDVELGIVVAYGALIPAAVLERLPMLNVHFSLLPRWRGAAPVQRAILAGDVETGVVVMSLETELDTGPIHLERRQRVDDMTSGELTAALARLGADALVDVLATPALLATSRAQRGEITYADKLTTETFHLRPTMTSEEVVRTVRLERAFTFVDGRRLRVLRGHALGTTDRPAGTLEVRDAGVHLVARDGAVMLDDVQPEGGRPMTGWSWWTGVRHDPSKVRWT